MADKKISALTGATTPLAGTEVLPIVQGGSTVKVSVDNLTVGKTVTTGDVISVKTSAGAVTDVITVQNLNSTAGTEAGIFFSPTSATGNIRGARISGINDGGNVVSLKFYTGTGAAITSKFEMTADGNLAVSTAAKGIDFSANTHAAGMTSELLNWFETGTWSPSLFDSAGNALTLGTAVGRYTRVGNAVTVTCAVSWTALGSAGATPLILAGLPFASANVAGLNQSAALGFIDGIDTVLGTKQITANLPLNVSYFTFKQTNDNAAPTDLAANSCSATGEIRLSTTYIV